METLLKVLIIGDSGVGKSSLLLRYADNTFSWDFLSTIGVDFKVRTLQIGEKVIKMQIWDTAGEERFRAITLSYYRGAHGIIVVYDVTSRESFENIRSIWLKQIGQCANVSVVTMLVGNKTDLSSKRSVSSEEGKQLAEELHIPYMEVSAQEGKQIDEIFLRVARDVLKNLSTSSKGSAIDVPTYNIEPGNATSTEGNAIAIGTAFNFAPKCMSKNE